MKNNRKNEIALNTTYLASVSGGKYSLLMFQVILQNLDKWLTKLEEKERETL